MIQISDNTQQIQPSKIRKMFNKALEYDHVISFTLGEPDFTASPNVVEAGVQGHSGRKDQVFRKCRAAGSAPGDCRVSPSHRGTLLRSCKPNCGDAWSHGSLVFGAESAAESWG